MPSAILITLPIPSPGDLSLPGDPSLTTNHPPSVLTCYPSPTQPIPSRTSSPHSWAYPPPPGGLTPSSQLAHHPTSHPTTPSPPGSSPSRRWRAWPTVLPWGSRAQGCQTSAPRCSSTSSSWVRADGQGSAACRGLRRAHRGVCPCGIVLSPETFSKISQPHFVGGRLDRVSLYSPG